MGLSNFEASSTISSLVISTTTVTDYSSTTVLTVDSVLYVNSLNSALPLVDANGKFEEYTGASCTDQFFQSLNGAGVVTCATVDISGTTNLAVTYPIILTGDTLSFAATSTAYGTGTAGYVLAWANGIPTWQATSTCVQITGSSELCDGDDEVGAGGGGAWPFTPNFYLSISNQSTTTNFYLPTAQIIASSTFFTQASTTMFTNTGNTYFTGLISKELATDSTGRVYGAATTTFSTGLTYLGGAVTCDTASATVFGCLTAASFSKFSSATTTALFPVIYSGVTNTFTTAATSTAYGNGAAGQVLAWANGKPTWQSTSTCAQITGSSGLCDGNDEAGAGAGNVVATTTKYSAVDSNNKTVTAWCPVGYKVTGGGVIVVSGANTDLHAENSHPTATSSGWIGSMNEGDAIAGNWGFAVTAMCLQVP